MKGLSGDQAQAVPGPTNDNASNHVLCILYGSVSQFHMIFNLIDMIEKMYIETFHFSFGFP